MPDPRASRLRRLIAAEGVRDAAVLDSVENVPRHRFVPPAEQDHAYGNHPLPIGYRQTISQPFVVALMTEALAVQPGARVLEIGTGSGYQAAVLARLEAEVWSVEIVPELAAHAAEVLQELGIETVHVRAGDGNLGWPEEAPFDRIIATAAAREIPPALLDQLKPGGILVMPLEEPDGEQNLLKVTFEDGGVRVERFCPVRFVPFVGGAVASGQDNR